MTDRFSSVLVANRGEIACRVITTLARMGIRSIAVYSDADRDARHVGMADVAMRIGPAAAAASYLDIDALIAAARAAGAQAVHPGYGFLSENADFAQACTEAGIVFIGPGVRALNVMGDKIRAKNHVAAHRVPVIPGIAEPGLTNDELVRAAADVGYPLLVKPSAGGGGKGMRVVDNPDDLESALAAARRVAASAFGDDTLFLERLIERPRHIEVQVLADNHGNVIHLGERECSLQRRHQKVIEEAPSPLLDAAVRTRIGEAACQVARSVGYSGAGTVEFLVAAPTPDEFFFMEMNTRLQVEHPVTEMVTGIDLVEWQVRVAAGEKLSMTQDDIVLTGHAIEARVYAEDPERGFLPTAGTVLVVDEPAGDGIRVDTSLIPGLIVGSHYDPLLAKVIAWGDNRREALTRLDTALAHTSVLGLHTNVEYVRALLADCDVQAGNLDTGLIERRMPQLAFRHVDAGVLTAAALYLRWSTSASRWSSSARAERGRVSRPEDALDTRAPSSRATRGPEGAGPWSQASGWRMGGTARPYRYSIEVSPTEFIDVLVKGNPEHAEVTVGDEQVRTASLIHVSGSRFSVEFDGVSRVFHIAHDGASIWVGDHGFTVHVTVRSRARQLADALAGIERGDGNNNPHVRSPMPGTVILVDVADGDTVQAGQTLITVEAMKMEHKLLAPVAGTVSISVAPGDLVKLDQVVASIQTPASSETPASIQAADQTSADDTPTNPASEGDRP